MNSRLVKRIINLVGIVLVILFASAIFIVFNDNKKDSASAAVEDLHFTVEAGIYDDISGDWIPYIDTEVQLYRISFRFNLTGDNPNPSVTEFMYIAADTYSQAEQSTNWTTDGENNAFLQANNMYTHGMMIWTFPQTDSYRKFVRFKAIAVTTIGGSAEPIIEEYELPNVYEIAYDNTINEADIRINRVEAEYLDPNAGNWKKYGTVLDESDNIWVSTKIRFKIISKNKEMNGNIKEKFYYSLDEGISWHPTEDICILEENINGPIQFMVSDMGGYYKSYYTRDEHDNKMHVKMDIILPEFRIQAVSTKIVNGEAVEYDYNSSMWSYQDIVYKIIPTAKGESQITYEYSIGASGWNVLTKNTGSQEEYYILPLNSTTREIAFRATNLASKRYQSPGTNDAFIDKVQPVVSITARDHKDTEIKSFGTLEGQGYRVGYASDSLRFIVYNKNAEGDIIYNQSELYYTYKYSYLDSEGQLRETNYASMLYATDINNVNYYTFMDSVVDRQTIDKRTYTIRLESRSGLYDEKSFTASILYSDFEISVDLISYIANDKGWANEAIPVYINAPIAEKYIFAYSISGSGYEEEKRFVWVNDGSGDGDELVKDVSEEFADLREGQPGYIEEGMAKFRIYLSTSVERRKFIIYAYNAAEARSSNESTSQEIKLDMVIPNVKMDAYIQHSQIRIESGDWVNGNIELTLDARALPLEEVSLSGLSCELMIDQHIPADTQPKEQTDNDVPNGRFLYLVELADTDGAILTKTLMFRLISGSGLQNFVYFDVRIDKRDINLMSVNDITNNDVLLEHNENHPVFVATTQYVCNDIEFNFASNHTDHFHFWYSIGDAFIKDTSNTLIIPIPLDTAGIITLEFYLASNAIDAEGASKRTDTYTITIPYDCISVQIFADIQPPSQSYEIDQNGWRSGPLSFLITLPAGEEYIDYTYGVIILNDKTPEQYYAEKGLTDSNQKALIFNYCTPVALIDGVFDFWGVDENNKPRFFNPQVSIDATENCFYTGNFLIFAFNAAKYSSNPVPFYTNEIRVDNSIPNAMDLIETLNGEIDDNYVYNNEAIVLRHPNFSDRAKIDYYHYMVLGDNIPDNIPTTESLNGWVKFELSSQSNIIIDYDMGHADGVVYYLYAINTLTSSNSVSNGQKFVFVIDKDEPRFDIGFPEDKGSNSSEDINGEQYDIFTFSWSSEINIEFNNTSNTGVYYWYSFDNMRTWEKWNNIPSTQPRIIFNFYEDINSTVFFKITNQAGSENINKRPAVVRIDSRTPEFALEAYVGGSIYNGGGYGQIDETGNTVGHSFADTSGNWASSAITIAIKINPEKRNTSPLRYQYSIITKTSETPYLPTPSDVLINDMITFTTDRMDSFGKNNDAIIVVKAICDANEKTFTQAIRVKIDKIRPEFKINGAVETDSGQTKTLISGQWTNREEVTLNIQRTTSNVSNVRIVYFRGDSTLENQWPTDGVNYGLVTVNESETITVEARSESHLVYRQIFEVNIDTVPPQIESGTIVPSVTDTPNTYYIDQPITYREENLKSAQYITRKGDTVGFPLSQGHIIATNSVDNSEASRGYVKIIIEDLAGNIAELEFYMVPFQLTVNNLTLSRKDLDTVDRYQEDLNNARGIDDSRRAYFESQIARLRDRESTLRQEIAGFQSYLAGLSQKASYELKSDYREMKEYLTTYYEYEYYNQQWIQETIIAGEYFAYFQKLEEEFGRLDKEMEKVRLVEENTKKLPAINVVKVTDYNSVLQVYDSYLDLLADQKSVYATTLYNKLITLKRKCENMLLQDMESGIKIEGNLAPGARIEVVPYPNTVELFNNAQETILNTVKSDKPRTIISINKVGIRGAASQTSTGDILVTLPIPEDFYSYVRFAVYRLSPDGTVTEVRGVEIQGDGKSVVFEADSLDTYILATRANIAIREQKDNIYGTIGDIEVDTKMITYIAIATIGIFVILMVVVILTGVRRRRFLSHYNKAHKGSLYRKGVQDIPKGNKPPREHPFKDERVKTPSKPIIRDK